MRYFFYIVAMMLVALVFAVEGTILYINWAKLVSVQEYDKLVPLVQSLLTPVVSMATVAFSFVIVDRQFQMNAKIEQIKQRLGERYKRESDAYMNLWRAVSATFRIIAKLEVGALDKECESRIEQILSEAEQYAFILSNENEREFYNFFQAVDNLRGLASKELSPQELKQLWVQEAKSIAEMFENIKLHYQQAYLGDIVRE